MTCVACGMKHARIAADYSCEMCPFTPNHSGCIMMSVALALPVIGLIKDTSKGKNTGTKRDETEWRISNYGVQLKPELKLKQKLKR